MIRGNVPDEWSRHESGPPAERWQMIEEFLRALGPSSAPPKRTQVRWTAQEWANLHFLLWRVENGMVAK